MSRPDELLVAFIDAYKSEFGEDLSLAEAETMMSSLVSFYGKMAKYASKQVRKVEPPAP